MQKILNNLQKDLIRYARVNIIYFNFFDEDRLYVIFNLASIHSIIFPTARGCSVCIDCDDNKIYFPQWLYKLDNKLFNRFNSIYNKYQKWMYIKIYTYYLKKYPKYKKELINTTNNKIINFMENKK